MKGTELMPRGRELVLAVSLGILSGSTQVQALASEVDFSEAKVGWILAQSTAYPELVLDGTDLVELSMFSIGSLAEDADGEYIAEQGGALLALSIARQDDVHWVVERIYKEPGLDDQKKAYLAEMHDGYLISSNEDLIVKSSNEGVLVLELNSDNETIPPNYWIHYVSSP